VGCSHKLVLQENGEAEGFCSWDWGHNGYKVDMNLWSSRYILQTWQLVKEKEGIESSGLVQSSN